jgi:hypothetical protein
MFTNTNKKNIIVFAAGGGNDIFSSLAYINCHLTEYKKNEKNIALIGILGFTPLHTINDKLFEEPLIVPNNEMKRYLLCEPIKQISCQERLLPKLINEITPNITKYICMSPKYFHYALMKIFDFYFDEQNKNLNIQYQNKLII